MAIKGNTNVTFQDKEAELRQRNNLRGLVEFTDFTDTLFIAKTKAIDSLSLSGNDIRLNLHISPPHALASPSTTPAHGYKHRYKGVVILI